MSYIIPYGQTQECNIYGPLCQTGSITVGVNLTTTTTSTVLPCSSYLTVQSTYMVNSSLNEMGLDWPVDWAVSFGQSPECRSYAQEISSGRYTISGCGDQNTIISTASGAENIPTQLPPGVVRWFSEDYVGFCCGDCSLNISEVRLYYFPDNTTPDCQYNETSNSSSILSGRSLKKRVHSLIGDGSIAIVSGHTLLVKWICFPNSM